MDLKSMTPKEIRDHIMKHSQAIEDDEWLEINKWIDEFLKGNLTLEEKRMFGPLGCTEIVSIICDGILRWRNSICIRCKKQQRYDKYSCAIYQKDEKHLAGIPNEIWAKKDADCPYFEE